MTMESLHGVLEAHPFLEDVAPEHIQTIVGCASNRRFEAGEYLCREGEKADQLYLLREGRVTLEVHLPQGGGLRIATLEGGDVLGWSWLIEPYRWPFDAVTLTEVRALALHGDCLRKKSLEDHELGYQLLTRLASSMQEHLHATRMQLIDVYARIPGGKRGHR